MTKWPHFDSIFYFITKIVADITYREAPDKKNIMLWSIPRLKIYFLVEEKN